MKKYILFGSVVLASIVVYTMNTSSFVRICRKTSSKQTCLCVEKSISEDLRKAFVEAYKKTENGEEASLKDFGLGGMLQLGEAYQKCGDGKKQRNSKNENKRVSNLQTIAINEVELSKIKIGNSKVKKYTGRYAWDNKTVVSFDIENGTNEPISNVSFHAVLLSEGREIPWLEDHFTYDFPGGLNPNERQHLDLEPNMFSEWGQIQNRKDYKLILEVMGAKGADGNVLWQR